MSEQAPNRSGPAPAGSDVTRSGAAQPKTPASPERPEILAGTWFPDGWTTPYLRGRFPALGGPARLHLAVHLPATDAPEGAAVVLRLGARVIATLRPSDGRFWTECDGIDLPGAEDMTWLDLSLRAAHPTRPGKGDNRTLGVVLRDWQVRAAPDVAPTGDNSGGTAP